MNDPRNDPYQLTTEDSQWAQASKRRQVKIHWMQTRRERRDRVEPVSKNFEALLDLPGGAVAEGYPWRFV